jgi:glycosyltransferase involved in cell wall biosynthesis
MRVVHLSTEDAGSGAFVAAQRLVAAQRAKAIEASLLVGAKHTTSPNVRLAELGMAGLHRQWLRKAGEALNLLGKLANWRRDRFQFAAAKFGAPVWRHRLVREADVIHLHWTNHGFISLAGLRRLASLGKPVVWTLHDRWALTGGCLHPGTCTHYLNQCGNCPMLQQPSQKDLSAQLWRQKRELYQHLKPELVAVSGWLASEVRRASLTHELPVHLIANAIDTKQFSPQDRTAARRRLALSAEETVVLFVSRRLDDFRKGLSDLLAALRMLTSPVVLLTVGESDIAPDQLGSVRHVGLGSISDPSEMARVYSAADVFAAPSLEDNLPTTVIEAMACGLPVAGYRTGGIPEMVIEGSTGLLVPTNDVSALSIALNQLVADPELRDHMGQAARTLAVERYSETAVVAQYAELYQLMLARA